MGRGAEATSEGAAEESDSTTVATFERLGTQTEEETERIVLKGVSSDTLEC